MKQPRVGALVHVLWLDACSWGTAWEDADKTRRGIRSKKMAHVSVGFVVKAKRQYIAVAPSVHPAGQRVSDVTSIPWGAVQDWTHLSPAKGKGVR